MTTPGCLKYVLSSEVSLEYSDAPHEFETTFAPSATASFSAAPRLASEAELASTSRIVQFWQIACAVSTSSAISRSQPEFRLGYVVPPVWLTFLKQPLADVHAGRPYCVSKVPRSLSMFGSS